jgi:predicted RND superfamily exporter protein
MGSLARFIVGNRMAVIAVAALVCAGFGLSLRGIHYQTDYTRYSRNRESAVDDNNLLVEKYGGFASVNLSLNAPDGRPNCFLNPDVLQKVALFEDQLTRDSDIASISSFTAYLRSMNRTMKGSNDVPGTRPLILLLSRYFAALRRNDCARSSAEFWGGTISVLYIAELLTRNMLSSIVSSPILVFLLSALVFRSAKLGLFVLVPLASGIMVNFIIMSIFSIPLDVVTISFSAIAIGIGVDNAIHLTIQYRRQRGMFPDAPDRAIEHALKIAGRPMLLRTLSIMSDLLGLVLSSFNPIAYFGLLISLSLVLTTAGALIVLPVLLYSDAKRLARKVKWAEHGAAPAGRRHGDSRRGRLT